MIFIALCGDEHHDNTVIGARVIISQILHAIMGFISFPLFFNLAIMFHEFLNYVSRCLSLNCLN